MIMVHEEKNIETKLSQLGINIKFLVRLICLTGLFGLLWTCGASFSVMLEVYLGYKVLRLVLRLFGLIAALIFTTASIIILIVIISLLIF